MARKPKILELDLESGASRQKAKNLTELNSNLKNNYNNLSQAIRPELNRLVKHEILLEDLIQMGVKLTTDLNKMAAVLSNFYFTADRKGILIGDTKESIIESGSPERRYGRIETQFDEVKRKTKSLFDARFFNGRAFGHQDVTVVGVRLSAFIDATERLEQSIIAVGVQRRRGKEYKQQAAINKLPVKGIGTLKTRTIGELRKARKAAQKMFLGTTVLKNLPTNSSLSTKTKWMDLASEVNKIKDVQEYITSEKKKYFAVRDGIANIKLRVELKRDNDFKAFYEKAFGRNLSPIIKQTNRKLDKYFKQEFLDQVDVTGIKGSPSLSGAVVEDLTNIALGKKTKRKTYTRRRTTKVDPPTRRLPNFRSPTSLIQLEKKAKETKALFASMKLKPSKTREKGGGDTQREINKLKLQINRRLPAEVRRNMGRPALINQTGRFSDSVELSDLRQGPKTLIGEYRYQFDPYETFENQGPRRWPTGYNPKPLITKSIRNLAAQYTEQKFTLRRE